MRDNIAHQKPTQKADDTTFLPTRWSSPPGRLALCVSGFLLQKGSQESAPRPPEGLVGTVGARRVKRRQAFAKVIGERPEAASAKWSRVCSLSMKRISIVVLGGAQKRHSSGGFSWTPGLCAHQTVIIID